MIKVVAAFTMAGKYYNPHVQPFVLVGPEAAENICKAGAGIVVDENGLRLHPEGEPNQKIRPQAASAPEPEQPQPQRAKRPARGKRGPRKAKNES